MPAREIVYAFALASSQGSDKPALPRSLVRAFAAPILTLLKYRRSKSKVKYAWNLSYG